MPHTEESTELRSIIRYYTDCFRSDNREIYLSDFLGSKVQQRYFFDGKEELLNGHNPYVPIENEHGEALLTKAFLEQKEKQLVHASCFLLHRVKHIKGDPKTYLSPLILHPAHVFKKDEFHYVEIKHEQRIVNQDIFRYFPEISGEELSSRILKSIGFDPLNFGSLGKLVRVIEAMSADIQAENLLLYPKQIPEKKLRQQVRAFARKKDQKPTFLHASALGLIQKSQRAAGIAHELEQIASQSFSAPLRKVFGFGADQSTEKVGFNVTPTLLNKAQQTIVEQANKNTLSVVIGPPGTGKSFTIAALAVNQMSQGKSVLVAAHTETAVNVLAEKVEGQLGLTNMVVRGGDHQRQQELKKYLQQVLSKMVVPDVPTEDEVEGLRKAVEVWQYNMSSNEKAFEKLLSMEKKWTDFLLDEERSMRFFYGSNKRYVKKRNDQLIPLWDLICIYQDTMQCLLESSNQYLKKHYKLQLAETIRENRRKLRLFLKGLQARLHSHRLEYFAQSGKDAALRAFPIWFTTTSFVDRILPLERELFDLVIIDEATQCSIPEVLPLLQRAKKAVIVGDPRQLRFVSFLSFAKEASLQQSHDIGDFKYRDFSILDQAEETISNYQAINFLNEHFRSVPPIIHFSNKQFYSSALEVLSNRPEENYLNALKLEQCEDGKHEKGCNQAEVHHILSAINKRVESEQKLPKAACSSIGVLSPFRAQADALLEAIRTQISFEHINRHRILVGTAHAFQGEERDHMFISLSLDNNTHHTAYRFLNRADVFNVMITRAKKFQTVCYSFDPKQLPDETLVKAYLLGNVNEELSRPADFNKDRFGVDVGKHLKEKGHQYWPLYKLGSLDIDLLVKLKTKLIAIDLIGYPGAMEGAFPFDRYKMLNRLGIKVFPLPYSHWYADPENCYNALQQFKTPRRKTKTLLAHGLKQKRKSTSWN